jgi:hypothetical protein
MFGSDAESAAERSWSDLVNDYAGNLRLRLTQVKQLWKEREYA